MSRIASRTGDSAMVRAGPASGTRRRGRGAPALALLLGASLLFVGPLTATGAGAVTPASLHAVGSAEQVYVTGLGAVGPDVACRLGGTDPRHPGRRLPRWPALPQRAAGQGLPSGPGIDGAESGRITVHGERAAPWDPGIYHQTIPDSGYPYLTTRDGTKLAIDVHPAHEPGR